MRLITLKDGDYKAVYTTIKSKDFTGRILFSYGLATVGYRKQNGEFVRFCDISDVSQTTNKHIKAFFEFLNKDYKKSDFEKFPYIKLDIDY